MASRFGVDIANQVEKLGQWVRETEIPHTTIITNMQLDLDFRPDDKPLSLDASLGWAIDAAILAASLEQFRCIVPVGDYGSFWPALLELVHVE